MLMQANNIAIFVHKNPDGDTMGAGFGLWNMLNSLGKVCAVYSSDGVPTRYAYLAEGCTLGGDIAFAPDFFVAVDVADPKLMGDFANMADKIDLCIDHHVSNVGYAKHTLLDDEAAATCQVLYNLGCHLPVQLTPQIANCLYTGIATDTGCFQYQNASANAHRVAAQLIDAGADYAAINRQMFDTKSKSRMAAEQLMISRLHYWCDGKIAIATIDLDDMEQLGLESADFDGIAGIPRQVEGVEIGITLRQLHDNVYKASVRSSAYANVSALCKEFGGGGHMRAAGCEVCGTAKQVEAALAAAAERYI